MLGKLGYISKLIRKPLTNSDFEGTLGGTEFFRGIIP